MEETHALRDRADANCETHHLKLPQKAARDEENSWTPHDRESGAVEVLTPDTPLMLRSAPPRTSPTLIGSPSAAFPSAQRGTAHARATPASDFPFTPQDVPLGTHDGIVDAFAAALPTTARPTPAPGRRDVGTPIGTLLAFTSDSEATGMGHEDECAPPVESLREVDVDMDVDMGSHGPTHTSAQPPPPPAGAQPLESRQDMALGAVPLQRQPPSRRLVPATRPVAGLGGDVLFQRPPPRGLARAPTADLADGRPARGACGEALLVDAAREAAGSTARPTPAPARPQWSAPQGAGRHPI